MSKLEQLINELCPDGVEYKPIADYIAYQQPTKFIVKSTNYDDSFQIPVLTAGQTFVLGYTNESFGIYEAETENPVIIFDDFTTSSHWVDFNFKIKSSAIKLLTSKQPNLLVLRYFYHVIKSLNYQPDFSKHERHWISKFSNIKIPIPPLPIQEEIVRILDSFTELTTELTAEITAELTARRKQYEYYRNHLLEYKSTSAPLVSSSVRNF